MCYSYKDRKATEEIRKVRRDAESRRRRENRAREGEKDRKLVRA